MRRVPLALHLALIFAAAIPVATSAAPLAAARPENAELRLGREAFARGENAAAAGHLSRAAAELDVSGDTEALAAVYLELGRVQLIGFGKADEAVATFLKSAELAARPADALLWAAAAADKLGIAAAARRYREQALRPPSAGKEAPPTKPAFHSMSRSPAAAPARPAAVAPDLPPPSPPPSTATMAASAPAAPEPHVQMTTFYLVLLRRGPTWTADQTPAVQQLQEGHMANIHRLAAAGKLLVAGPFLEQTGKGALAGLFIFQVASLDEAKAAVATDPMVRSGRLVAEVYPWLGPAGLHP
ncbi:MAG TPA: YciI family protein [Thermoanaerobaculia bacterium]|jgi:uncharacterized protein YciI